MSKTELRLWQELRRRPMGLRFRRQHPVGPYILDFYCHAARLAVEVDDDSHIGREARDAARDKHFVELGIKTVRCDWPEVWSNLDGVVETIMRDCFSRAGIDYDHYLEFVRKPSP